MKEVWNFFNLGFEPDNNFDLKFFRIEFTESPNNKIKLVMFSN